uniref:SERPIN domain-containing protein n=1 Tax=Rhabditophanes sp. KR3021 TaxID=114890 RepID=A0AC35TMF5_9BILA
MSDILENKLVCDSQISFSISLLKQLFTNDTKNESFIFSPISLSMSLAMVFAGAKNQTKEELSRLLIGGEDIKYFHNYFAIFFQHVKERLTREEVKLYLANSIYLAEDLTLENEFMEVIGEYYNGQINQVDFKDSAVVADEINNFVEQITNHVIKNMVSSDSFNENTRLVLINAIYFKASFDNIFDEVDTYESDFYMTSDKTKKVEMMHKTDRYFYNENDQFQILIIPYNYYSQYFYILLPKENTELNEALTTFNADTFVSLSEEASENKVQVSLPKFKIDSKFEMKDVLKCLGMSNLFSDKADFSGISKNEGLQISSIHQKASFEVNEKGVEAAAATASFFGGCAPSLPQKEFIFCANRPFMFFIGKPEGKYILFSGIYK